MFNYNWQLKDGFPQKGIKKNGLKVYSTFACGGGSSMGYKLAGFEVIGANDIDPQMEKVYKNNLDPKFYDLCSITDLLNKDLPGEYYNLDILDGSPPCSTFSMSGKREKGWKKDKRFREGQAKQILSDLFFDWIKLVEKLKPKIAIGENVKGIISGNAKAYTQIILSELNKIGYDVQLFLLDASTMGVPQRRQRVFFICKRKDLNFKTLRLNFNERPIKFKEIFQLGINDRKLQPKEQILWDNKRPHEKNLVPANIRLYNKDGYFKSSILYNNNVVNTIIAGDALVLDKEPRHLNFKELTLASSFPIDYNFLDINVAYLVGMSVPPVMMANIAYQIYEQLFKGM